MVDFAKGQIEVALDDDQVEPQSKLSSKHKTDKIGDGKIFVSLSNKQYALELVKAVRAL